jgi:hypothetical protein
MLSLRTTRFLALAMCLLLGWAMVQRGLFHRCEHVVTHTQGAPTVKGLCPVCDAMLPVFNATASVDLAVKSTTIIEIVAPSVPTERLGYSSLLPGRGPPSLVV